MSFSFIKQVNVRFITHVMNLNEPNKYVNILIKFNSDLKSINFKF